MSTLVSAFYDLGEVLYKNNNNNSRTHLKTDRKAVGTPINFTRRNSNSNSTSANGLNSKLNNSNSTLISYSDSSINISNNRESRRLDRSLSEPTERNNGQHKNNQANSSRYKTELCRPYEENGTCKYGDKCQFAHGAHELRTLARHPKYKTELCRTYHTIGFCPYGPRCHFIHNADDNKIQSHPVSRETTPRPKALSTGSFSLGSGADSPPSSLCDSPSSLSPTFLSDDPFSGFANISSPATPTANNAFTFSQDFPSLMTPIKVQTQNVPQAFNMNRVNHYNMLNQRNLNEDDSVFRESIIVPDAPPSPSDSISSDLDNACLNGFICGSPLDVSRLPIFSRLSTSED